MLNTPSNTHLIKTTISVALTASLCYFCTYMITTAIFAGTYNTSGTFGNTKTALTVAQLLGFVIGKLLGAFLLGRVKKQDRFSLLTLIFILSTVPMIIFGLLPIDGQVVMMFLSSIPFILSWGFIVFYVEGRHATTLIVMFVYMALIMASGIAKTVATLILNAGVSDSWMPAVCSSMGMVLCILFSYMLSLAPPPTQLETDLRQSREPCSLEQQREFMNKYKVGLIIINIVYGVTSAYRSFRDYYALELWKELLSENFDPYIYSVSEIVVSVLVSLVYCFLFFIKDEVKGLMSLFYTMFSGGVLVLLVTVLYRTTSFSGVSWIVSCGVGLYLTYIPPGALLYDKLVGATKINYTSVFLVYVSETVATSVSLLVILLKNLVFNDISFVKYFEWLSYTTAVTTILGMLIICIFFYSKLLRR